jgi:hypothetical protein
MGQFFKLKHVVRTEHGIAPTGTPVSIANTSTSLSDGVVNTAYSTSFTASGGELPYTAFTVTGGSLPSGLSLSTSGALTGTPSTVQTSTFTVHVVDSTGTTASMQFRLAVASSGADNPGGTPFQWVQSTSLTQGVVNTAYSVTLDSTGGVTPYRNFVVIGAGSLPAGLSLSSASGALTGTPSTTVTSTFTVEATDSTGSTISREFRLNVISSAAAGSTDAHAFYTNLITFPELFKEWSLRSQSQLNGLVTGAPSTAFQYIWPTDAYADPQDAAKFYKLPNSTTDGSDSIPGNKQIKAQLGIPMSSADTYLFIWDQWWGPEWQTNRGGVGQYKTINIRSDVSSGSVGGTIHYGSKDSFTNVDTSTQVTAVQHTVYPSSTKNEAYPVGLTKADGLAPTGAGALPRYGYFKHPSVWTRHWVEVRCAQAAAAFSSWNNAYGVTVLDSTSAGGLWNMWSEWIADENHDPQRVTFQVPWKVVDGYLSIWNGEFNTSSKPSSNGSQTGASGPLVAYLRNLVILKNYTLQESDTVVFKRPI